MKRRALSRQEVQAQVESHMGQVAEVLFRTADSSWASFLEEQWTPGKPLYDSVHRLMVCSSFPLTDRAEGPKVGCNDPRLLDVLAGKSNRKDTQKKREKADKEKEDEEEEDEEDEEFEVDESGDALFLDEEGARAVDLKADERQRNRVSGYPAVEHWLAPLSLVPRDRVRGIITCLAPMSGHSRSYQGMAMGQDDTSTWRGQGGGGGPSDSGEGGWERLENINRSMGRKNDPTQARFHLWLTHQGLDEILSLRSATTPLEIPGAFDAGRALGRGKEKYSQGYDFTMKELSRRWGMLCLPVMPVARMGSPMAFHSDLGYRWPEFFEAVVRAVCQPPPDFPLLVLSCGRSVEESQEALPWKLVTGFLERLPHPATTFFWSPECHPVFSGDTDVLGVHNQRLRELGREPLQLWLSK